MCKNSVLCKRGLGAQTDLFRTDISHGRIKQAVEWTEPEERRKRGREGWQGGEKERKREKPSRELNGSRATIRTGGLYP